MEFSCIVVEDIYDIRVDLCNALRKIKGVNIVADVESVFEAFDAIQEHRPDALFLDIKLTGGSAFELLTHLNEAKIPIPPYVLMTAFSIDAFAETVLNTDYIQAPRIRYLNKSLGNNLDMELRISVEGIRTYLRQNKKFLNIGKNPVFKIPLDDILCLKSKMVVGVGKKNYEVEIKVKTRKEPYTDPDSLKSIGERLPNHFQYISQRQIVNMLEFTIFEKIEKEKACLKTMCLPDEPCLIGSEYFPIIAAQFKKK
jgi:DNA-binding LytR/AlgR family response regulator